MKNNKGITLVALVVTIIVLIILAGISINLTLGDNGIVTIAKKAKENIELAKVQEEKELNELYTQLTSKDFNSENLPYDSIAKLTEFKTAIANAINEAGGVKPEVTAETSVFANNIKGIVKEVTKNATATAEDIAKGKTAWVNGECITGTMLNISAFDTIISYASDIQVINLQNGNEYKSFTIIEGAKYLLITEARYNRIVNIFSGATIEQDISELISKFNSNSKAYIFTATSSNLVLNVTTSDYHAGIGILVRLS